jgi:uncharacterized membrane protein
LALPEKKSAFEGAALQQAFDNLEKTMMKDEQSALISGLIATAMFIAFVALSIVTLGAFAVVMLIILLIVAVVMMMVSAGDDIDAWKKIFTSPWDTEGNDKGDIALHTQ